MMLDVFLSLVTLVGAIFMLISAIGVWRLQDVYLKMHAATKAGTLGCGLILLSVGIRIKDLHGLTETILLILFIMITNPISAHLIGKLQYSRENR